jgi:DNA-binding NtrC family response regulator
MKTEIEQKQLATKIAKVASKIVPELVELTKGTEFSLTLLDDGEGFGMIINVSNVPQMVSIIIPELLKKHDEVKGGDSHEVKPTNEDEVQVIEVAEGEQMEDKEKECLAKALEQTNGDKRKAAELIGVSERSFCRKCKKYGIKFGARK